MNRLGPWLDDSGSRPGRRRGLILAAALLTSPAVFGQIVTDGSLGGGMRSLSGPNYRIGADLGQQAGGNLFHSFAQFGLATGQSATFSGPASVTNVIARVTGGSQSAIDGAIRSEITGANLFLFNPAGIAFGPNASLDISGSFHASSASYLRLDDGTRFNASPTAPMTLSVAAPEAFGFPAGSAQPIRVDALIEVPDGQTISFSGGDIGASGAFLSAPGGRIALTAIGSVGGEIPLAGGGSLLPANAGTIRLDGSQLLTPGNNSIGPGHIVIRGGRLVMRDSLVDVTNLAGTEGGGIDIQLAGKLEARASTISTLATASGRGSDIAVQAADILLTEGAKISAATLSEAPAGNLAVTAGNLVLDYGYLASETGGSGAAGRIDITASSMRLINDGAITVLTQGSGAGGQVNITTGSLDIAGGRAVPAGYLDPVTGLTYYGFYSGIYSTSQAALGGPGGNINIRADGIRIHDGGKISGITIGSGRAGNVTVTANSLSLTNGGLIHTTTSGPGAGGTIDIRVAGNLDIAGSLDTQRFAGYPPRGTTTSGIASKATGELNPTATTLGDGGTITVSAGRLSLGAHAEISAAAEGNATGGTITLTAGAIDMTGGRITSASHGSGNAGQITVDAGTALVMTGGAEISTAARLADGGNITVIARDVVKLSGSRITTSVGTGLGNGGNISIDPNFVILDKSQVVANAWGGTGGNINIVAGTYLSSIDSRVSASSQLGIDGQVSITSPNINAGKNLGAPPPAYVDLSRLLRETCGGRGTATGSRFVRAGRGGLAPVAGGSPLAVLAPTDPAVGSRPRQGHATDSILPLRLACSRPESMLR